ncbi:BnaA02g33070D [Brassica napus]|uniref:BnaA02g33070D protein n=1 Tax=Brassica napus TaxID=3708 RepID=A0A078GW37_BRANA|nr:BnaA02g33070D [Brassica napus]
MTDEEVMKHFEKAKLLNEKGDYIKALELLDDLISVYREDKNQTFLHFGQGDVFMRPIKPTWRSSVPVYSTCWLKTLRRAKHKLSLSSVPQPDDNKVRDEFSLENVTKEAEFMIAESKIMSIRKYAPPPEVCDSKKGEDRVGGELRSYWMGLDVKVKRDFMKVSVERVRRFVKGVHKSKGVDVLKHVMAIAREHKKWRVWVCRTKCDKVCFSAEECRTHLEEKHAANLEKDVVMRIGINWAYKIQHGRWEPVDTVAAVEMIKTQLEDVKAFTSRSRKKGWSDQWPLATADEERSDLLKEVKLLLVSLCEHQILSCSIRDWVMSFPVKHLRKLEVSEESIKDCRIVETPQSICFLERDELKQIRGFLKKIKCERHDGTDLIGRAVDIRDVFEGGLHLTFDIADLEDCMNLIRERSKSLSNDKVLKSIELLKSMVTEKVLRIDAKILLTDNSRIRLLDKLTRLSAFDNRSYMLYFLKPFLLNEIVIMKSKVKSDAAEADLLLKEGKKSLKEENKSQAKKTRKDKNIKINSTSVVTPVDKTVEHESSVKLEPEEHSKEPERGGLETSSNTDIQVEATAVDCDGKKSFSIVLFYMQLEPALEGAAARYNSALDMTLKNEIVNMEFNAKSDAAEADLHGQQITSTIILLFKEKYGFTLSKTFSYMSSKPSVDLQPGGISQSAKTMEEDSMETKDTLGSEKGPLETSSNNDIQEEANKVNSGDMQNMPGEDSVSGNLESALGGAATRYNSALDMTLKALVNVNVLKEQVVKYNKQPVPDNLGEQVLCALQSLFTSVVSEEIKTEGAYTLILRDLLVSLEEVDSMSSGAAEVLVTILESWHCWKNSERDSLVDRLFTAEFLRHCCGFRFNQKREGCGTTNFVHHVISRCPPIFIIVLEWEKSETEKEISETTKALEWEIDISRLYEGLEPNTNYRLVSMVGYGEEDEEHICMVYEKNRWVNLRRESLAGEVVGNNWKNVVTFCGERKVRPVILLYEAV